MLCIFLKYRNIEEIQNNEIYKLYVIHFFYFKHENTKSIFLHATSFLPKDFDGSRENINLMDPYIRLYRNEHFMHYLKSLQKCTQ